MDQSNLPPGTAAVRHDGWTAARKARFLEHLAGHGNVRAACACADMSHEAAYRLRRRDALFARAWAAALVHAREASAQVLACRAIDGIEEDVWYRGEVVGTRRRYDTRLLLAHMARLDALAQDERAGEDSGRFDELLACIAGAVPPDDLPLEEDGLPCEREVCIDFAGEQAEAAMQREEAEADAINGPIDPEEGRARDDRAVATWRRARARAGKRWDAWQLRAFATVDRLREQPLGGAPAASTARTPSTLSTSPLARGAAHGQPAASG